MRDRGTFGSLSFEDLEEEINIRKKLLTQMVGSLYPSIIRDDIIILEEQRWQISQE